MLSDLKNQSSSPTQTQTKTQPPDWQVADFPPNWEISSQSPNQPSPNNSTLDKYRQVKEQLDQINQENIRKQTLRLTLEELSKNAPGDFQQSQLLHNLLQHVNNPKYQLNQSEQQTLEQIQNGVNISLSTSKDSYDFTNKLFDQLSQNKKVSTPQNKDQFQLSLNPQIDQQVPNLEKLQHLQTQINHDSDLQDAKAAIKGVLNNQQVDESDQIATNLISDLTIQSLTKTDNSPIDVKAVVDSHLKLADTQTKTDITTILSIDHQLLQSKEVFHTTRTILQENAISKPQTVITFFQSNNLSPVEFHTLILKSPQTESSSQRQSPQITLQQINSWVETYNKFIQISGSNAQPISFWSSPREFFTTFTKNIGSSSQVGIKSFFQRIGSLFSGGGGGAAGGSVGSPLASGAKSTLGQLLKTGAQGLGNFAKMGVKGLGKLGVKAIQGIGSLITKIAVALGPEVLAAAAVVFLIVILIFSVLAFFNLSGASPEKITAMQTDSISGQGGGMFAGGFCDPEVDANCVPLFCEGDCSCPVTGAITQGPGGDYSHIYNGTPVNAVDIGLTTGDPIYSLSAGTVIYAAFSPAGYGNLVVVENSDGTQLYYGHLEWFNVTVGQEVEAGEQLGAGDNTGNSTGPHLHLEYRGTGVQNILYLLGFSDEQVEVLNGCNSDCGGIICQN